MGLGGLAVEVHRPGDHAAVVRAVEQQVLVGALGDGLVVLHQHDPVGVVQPQRRHGGDHGRPATTDVGHPLGDPRLGVGVDGGRGLDQHEHRRLGRDRAGQHDPLALPAGQATTALVELALPAAGQGVVDVLGVGDAQGVLGLAAVEAAVRVDGVLEGAGEQLAAGVADEDPASYVGQPGLGQVDAAQGHAPPLAGALLVAGRDPGTLGLALGPGTPGGAALDPLADVLADRLDVGGEVAAQPVGERGGVLGHGADHDRQLTLAGHEAGLLVDQVAVLGQGPRVGRVDPRRLLLEDRDRPARRDGRPGELLGELEERLDRVDHEQRVAEEADQLADRQLAADHLAGARATRAAPRTRPENSTPTASMPACQMPADWPA